MSSRLSARKRKCSRILSRKKGKKRLLDDSLDTPIVSPTTSKVRPGLPVGRTLSNLRKEGIRIFSNFRGAKVPTLSAARLDGQDSILSTSTNLAHNPWHSPNNDFSPPNTPMNIDIPILPPLRQLRSTSIYYTNATGYDRESEPTYSSPAVSHLALHERFSTPELSRQPRCKISDMVLQNETVIHRPKLSLRPSVYKAGIEAVHDHDAAASNRNMTSDATSLPSTLPHSSNGLLTLSTAPTSLVSSSAPVSTKTTTRYQSGLSQLMNGFVRTSTALTDRSPADQCDVQTFLFPRQDAERLVRPSVATVEHAAAAKIFFESHFNQLLTAKVSPRSIRRCQVERKLANMALSSEELSKHKREWYSAETQHLRRSRVMKSKSQARRGTKGAHISQYDIIRVLGKGSFGTVRLVCRKSETELHECQDDPHNRSEVMLKPTLLLAQDQQKEVYAMKVIKKSDMLRNAQEGHLRAERDFLVASENSQWIVPLMAAFQDFNNLYLVMQYMVGGDFLGLLLREDVLHEEVAKWYLAEMILCVEEAHKMKWVHRDIKPDNFLITASGHLRISDFGLAFDGHWTHNQKYYTEQRHNLLREFDIQVLGDEQDIQDQERWQNTRNGLAKSVDGAMAKETQEITDPEGHVPVIDRLNSTQRRRFARSVVGTSQYMAPEVIRGENYDGRCD